MQVRWTEPAAQDLENITRRIRKENPAAARNVAKTLFDGGNALDTFPNRGRPGRIPGTRELVFSPLPYILVYRVKGDTVEIAYIYHGAQDWP
jgi:toxin ParE1/3/4